MTESTISQVVRAILHGLIGERLMSVGGTLYEHCGSASGDPLAVWLRFGDRTPWRFAGHSDGWHLIVDQVEPRSLDMQESGSVRFTEINPSIGADIVGLLVSGAWMICSPTESDVIGVRFDFESGEILRIVNWGDEILLTAELPRDAGPAEIIERPV